MMSGHVPLPRTPVLASAMGSVLLMVFWASYVLGPAALIGVAAHMSDAEFGTSVTLASLGFAATLLALKRAIGHLDVWPGM